MKLKKKKVKDSSASKKRKLEPVAALYSEDIGTEGIKTSGVSLSGFHQPSISSLPLADDEDDRRKKRMERFGGGSKEEPDILMSALSSSRSSHAAKVSKKRKSKSTKPFVGTSTALEKPYLRLTDFPKPENVRPLSVLIKSLAHVKNVYVKKENFQWANEQLKSIRQDLTVQHIRNDFVLEVYETHGRLLLEHGDLNEFHQCQTMIRSLTSKPEAFETLQREGKSRTAHSMAVENDGEGGGLLKQTEENADEFNAYALLYYLIQESWGEIKILMSTSKDSLDSETGTSSVPTSGKIPECLRGHSESHAIQVVKAVMNDDYQAFFRLYEAAPHLSAYLMDFLVRRVRKSAYERIIASYRPSLAIEHFREALFFQDMVETRSFLKSNGAIFIHELGPPFWVDCKATAIATGLAPIRNHR